MPRRIAITGTSEGPSASLVCELVALGHQVAGGARTKLSSLAAEPPGIYFEFGG